jgi:hypothetical protein
MKIHSFDGLVDFELGSIEPVTDRPSFLASALGRSAEVLVENEPHMTYRIHPERGIAATVHFEGPKLRTVSFQIELPPRKEEVWSEEHELERKRLHDEWLQDELGMPPYWFPWGRLESNYDSKGCSSAIIVSYAE